MQKLMKLKYAKTLIVMSLILSVLLTVVYVGVSRVYAAADVNKYDVYYELQFEDNTTEDTFSGFYYSNGTTKLGEPIEFKLKLNKNFKDESGNKIDGYNDYLTKEDMVKKNTLDDLKYRTSKPYPYYDCKNIETSIFVSLIGDKRNQDYYIGDITEKKENRTVGVKEEVVIVIKAPILQLNRNIEKVSVDYEGELSEETKKQIIENVKQANPNMNNIKQVRIENEKLYIEMWNRYHIGVPYLEFNLNDLYTRVKDAGTQTTPEVKVIYQFADGKAYKEFNVLFEKGYVLDASELEMLPDDMKFTDDFLFYEVKGDGTDKIVRTVEKIEKETSDAGTQTDKPETNDEGTQTDDGKTEDKETQTDLTADDIKKIEDKIKSLEDKIWKVTSESGAKDKLNETQKDEIARLEKEIKALEERLKDKDDLSKEKEDLKKQIEALAKKIENLQTNIKNGKSDGSSTTTPSGVTHTITEGGTTNSYSDSVGKDGSSYSSDSSKGSKADDEQEVRYPNKLTPKAPANTAQNADGTTNTQNTNKGIASAPSKARGTVSENVNNANSDYPIHHGDETDDKAMDMYAADARQFVTFQTKNGKTFHLIINHDEDSENVILLTEVSEDDLLNMVETKEKPEKEEMTPQKETEEPKEEPKKEEEKKSDLGTYILLALVVAGVLGGGYYFKVMKNKEKAELENLEEEDDFFSEAEEYEESEASETDDFVESETVDEEEI